MSFMSLEMPLSRPVTDYYKVRHLLTKVLRNRGFLLDRESLAAKQYLDLGCGANTHPEFINVDYNWSPGIDICWDITKRLPLPPEAVIGIFSEHCLEHLPLAAGDAVLGECWRLLKPGGTIRISVPDGELYLSRYVRIKQGDPDISLPHAQKDEFEGLYAPIMSVNRIFRAHGHQFIYDFETCAQLLKRNGFVDIRRESFRRGRDANLLLDREARALESLYVEASKPPVIQT
jgi:predicted SAM-dependent methyltransferase